MATIVDVARVAGVSISTVSHVLNGTRHVEPKTRNRVVAAIEQTGYRQDTIARSLRRSKTDSIGLIVSDAGEPAFAEMVHGVEQAAAERGLTLLLANSAESAERERKALLTLLNRRVDGVIVARAADTDPDLLTSVLTEKTAIVLLDRLYRDTPVDQVGADNRDSMRHLVRHLAAQGHHRFVVVAGDTRVPTLAERLDGFYDGLRDAGLDGEHQLVLAGEVNAEQEGRLAGALADPSRTAMIACSTPLAVFGLQSLAAAGRETPADIAFATFDGFDNPDLFHPRITTVQQPAFEMGFAAVGLLIERLESPDARPRTVRLHQELILRESTQAFRPTHS